MINGVFTSSALFCVTWSRPRPIAAQFNPNAEYLLTQVKNDLKEKEYRKPKSQYLQRTFHMMPREGGAVI